MVDILISADLGTDEVKIFEYDEPNGSPLDENIDQNLQNQKVDSAKLAQDGNEGHRSKQSEKRQHNQDMRMSTSSTNMCASVQSSAAHKYQEKSIALDCS